ncbi:acyltransferase family protein [Oleiharenicola sp. Vm1]|uniref:acyltransferase family protein n=1 Tax=Oleiharenicola sp. Vm1 TaxID=3398393 RepID=UPI0039F491C1
MDFLRGIAILLVCLGHHAIDLSAGYLSPVVYVWYRLGWTGVDLFFVLSGFLIGGLLFREIMEFGRLDTRRFIIRRGFKIWPLYAVYLVLAAFSYWQSNGYDTHRLWVAIGPNLLHVQNYFPTPLQHTWSLAVEEHFYLALPLLLWALLRWGNDRRLDRLPVVLGCVMVACALLRLPNLGHEFQPYTHGWPTHLRIDSLCVGVLVAYAYHNRLAWLEPIRTRPVMCLLVAALGLSPLLIWTAHNAPVYTIGYSVIAWAYALVLIAVCVGRVGSGIASVPGAAGVVRGVAYIGFYSYPIYLFHYRLGQMPAKWMLRHWSGSGWETTRWIAATSINLVTIVLIGVAFGKLAERPMLALRDRLFPARAKLIP